MRDLLNSEVLSLKTMAMRSSFCHSPPPLAWGKERNLISWGVGLMKGRIPDTCFCHLCGGSHGTRHSVDCLQLSFFIKLSNTPPLSLSLSLSLSLCLPLLPSLNVRLQLATSRPLVGTKGYEAHCVKCAAVWVAAQKAAHPDDSAKRRDPPPRPEVRVGLSALNCLPSTVCPQLSALNCLPSTVCPQLFALN